MVIPNTKYQKPRRVYGTPHYAFANKWALKGTFVFTVFSTALGFFYYYNVRDDPLYISNTTAYNKREEQDQFLSNFVGVRKDNLKKLNKDEEFLDKFQGLVK